MDRWRRRCHVHHFHHRGHGRSHCRQTGEFAGRADRRIEGCEDGGNVDEVGAETEGRYLDEMHRELEEGIAIGDAEE